MDDPALPVHLTLADLVGEGVLEEILSGFEDLFGVAVRVHATDGTFNAEVCVEREVCRFVNTTRGGRTECRHTLEDTRVGAISPWMPPSKPGREAEGGVAIGYVPCFTGNIYRTAEIQYDGEVLGRLIVGPYLPPETRDAPLTLRVAAPEADAEQATRLLAKMPRMRDATAERLVRHVLRVLEGVFFAGHRTFLTSQVHLATVRDSFRELSTKNRELAQTYERLKEVDRLKSNFLATVSHELRTPLTSILGYTEMLTEGLGGPLTSEQKDFVRTIHEKGEQLLTLISGILDLAKLDSGQIGLAPSWVDVRTLCEDVAQTVLPQARRGGVTVVVAAARELPRVWTDLEKLRQVLLNLTDNAVKFTPTRGTVTLGARVDAGTAKGPDDDVGLVVTAPARRDLVLLVADTGIGIAPATQDRIFDAFYQVDSSSTRRFGGAGLGLSIVRRLLEILGGRIDVRSRLGEGTTFEVVLPVQDPPPGEVE